MMLSTLHKLRKPMIAGLFALSGPVYAIDTATIVSSALSEDCIEFKVVGVCFWLRCTTFGCTVRTSVKIEHFVPEAVVSSYSVTGENPWGEVAAFSAPNPTAQDGGSSTTNNKRENEMSVFKNVDVIGHPATLFPELLSSTGLMCDGATTPFVPYFLSTLDTLAWRFGVPEMAYPESLIPGMREVAKLSLFTNWGNLYPREGFLHQPDDHKASAVMAQRAGDVVTRTGQPHVYMPIPSDRRAGYWPPEPLKEGDITNHKWQELVPKVSSSCVVFPHENFLEQAEDGGYAWALWRPYSCCKREGQTFLYSVDFQ